MTWRSQTGPADCRPSDLASAAGAEGERCNGLFGGTSRPMLPNLGIAMKMDDAK